MKLNFGYGNQIQELETGNANLLGVLMSNELEHENRDEAAIEYALRHPIGTPALRDMVSPGQKIVIVTSDITRPLPSYRIMPALLDELYSAGCKAEDISVVIARGSHRAHTQEELRKLLGDRCYEEVSVFENDRDDCVSCGLTSRGTPADFDRRVAEADFRICLGNVEFHYFAGYSGGYKALMPGVSTLAAIQANHRMMVQEAACAGKLEGNPLREDIEEAGALLGIDFLLNCVLDEHKHIVYATAGDAIQAHRKACSYLDKMYRKPISERADIVITSQGGSPKDANLYQTQKALDNAKHAVKDGGTIILVGACNEGFGNSTFESWFRDAANPHDLIDRIHSEFTLGGHKAAAIALVLERAEIYLISELDPELVRSIFLKPASSVQEAFDLAVAKHGESASVIAMPYGGSVLPMPAE